MKPLTLILLTIASIAHAAEWKLVWSDEFNYQGLPDPSTWGYEEGFVRNHELQYYTRERKENVRVENGMLTIEGRKEHFKNPTRTGPEFSEYTSASLITLNKASWCFGRIEARAKLPQGKGVWPAFWTWPDPKSGTLQNCSSARGFFGFMVCFRAGAVAPCSPRTPAAASGAGFGGAQPPSTWFLCRAAYSSGV